MAAEVSVLDRSSNGVSVWDTVFCIDTSTIKKKKFVSFFD